MLPPEVTLVDTFVHAAYYPGEGRGAFAVMMVDMVTTGT